MRNGKLGIKIKTKVNAKNQSSKSWILSNIATKLLGNRNGILIKIEIQLMSQNTLISKYG